jgi:hypothetical protein
MPDSFAQLRAPCIVADTPVTRTQAKVALFRPTEGIDLDKKRESIGSSLA